MPPTYSRPITSVRWMACGCFLSQGSRRTPLKLVQMASTHQLLVAAWLGYKIGDLWCFGADEHPAHARFFTE